MNDRVRRLTSLAVTAAVVVCTIAFGSPSSSRSGTLVGRAAHAKASARSKPAGKPVVLSAVTADLAELSSTRGAIGESLNKLTHAPGMPVCSPPPIPAATYPPGGSYGIPFLAAITDGQVLAGYDEWIANNTVYKDGSKTYQLYPWNNKISGITGWVTGLLQLPSLNATISPQDVVFCDQGGEACVKDSPPPAGECIDVITQYGPSPGSKTPPPPITNYPPHPGKNCWKSDGCIPIVVSLIPSGDTSVKVTGVEPDGALDLQVTTSAVSTATEFTPPPTVSFVCAGAATTISVSTESPTSLPPSAPPAPVAPNRDYRTLQTAPQALTGPLQTASSTVGGNDFGIAAFLPSAKGGPCYNAGAVPDLLNTYVGGFGPTFNDQDEGLYYQEGGKSATVAPAGWAQFSSTTSVVKLGLPVGPPSSFTFSLAKVTRKRQRTT